MKRLVLAATAAGAAAFTLRHLVRKARTLHDHCGEMMTRQCNSNAGCRAA